MDGQLVESERQSTTKHQEVINESVSIDSRTGKNRDIRSSTDASKIVSRMSRSEAIKHDAMKLKTSTLDRMGRMFKQRPRTPTAEKPPTPSTTRSVENCTDNVSAKQKTNSLGRMLKLVDKDGSSKKLFVQSRSGSLSRILRRHSQHEDNDATSKPSADSNPGMFSRMMNQLRGRPSSGSAKDNKKDREKMNSLPPKVPLSSRPTATNANSSLQSAMHGQKSTDAKYSL